MLTFQHSLPFSNYSGLYDIVVPKDHLLRQINDLIDFSFVYEELVSKYAKDKKVVVQNVQYVFLNIYFLKLSMIYQM